MIARFIHLLLPTPFRSERVSALACTNVDGIVTMLDHGNPHTVRSPRPGHGFCAGHTADNAIVEGGRRNRTMTSPLVQDEAYEGQSIFLFHHTSTATPKTTGR